MGGRLQRRIQNLCWERRLGIATRDVVAVHDADAYHYSAMSYSTIFRMLRFLDPRPSDVLVDVGSGKGRILCCAAQFDLAGAVGVEISSELCAVAVRNAQRLRRRRCEISVHQGPAESFDYDGASIVTLFNPFGPTTLDAVLSRIVTTADRTRRPVRIAYCNPAHEDVFQRHPTLDRYELWERRRASDEHRIAFYRSHEPATS